ncbi:hypothetical protein [Tatumella punctata]|uniref:Uncharacterized protein n=1 Tax=Tatumella punctata TaxID=399969 RepID=A0ABW1VQ19_9GAMM
MSVLYDPELNSALDQNGTEDIQHIDAGAWTGIGKGVGTGLSNAATSLSRMAANVGTAQMRLSGAQMMAGGSLEGDDSTVQAGADLSSVAQPTESQLPQYKSFDPEQVGTVGTILGGLAQQLPSLAAMVVNPVAGAVMAAAQGQTEAHAEGAKLGLTGSALEDYAGVGAVSGGVGASIPGFAGFGRGAMLYGSRFVLGGLANTAVSEADRWGRAAILDNAGFHDQANQMRQADGASIATDFVLGGAFGLIGGGHRTDTPEISPVTSVHEDAATAHLLHDNYVTESAPGLATDPASEAAHVNAMDSAGDSVNAGKAVDVSDHISGENTYLVHGDIDGPTLDRQALAGDASQRMDSIASAADQQSLPVASTKEFQPGVLSDTQANPFDSIREQAEALRETHPELSDLISTHLESVEAEHTAAHQNAESFDVAAACALKYGN